MNPQDLPPQDPSEDQIFNTPQKKLDSFKITSTSSKKGSISCQAPFEEISPHQYPGPSPETTKTTEITEIRGRRRSRKEKNRISGPSSKTPDQDKDPSHSLLQEPVINVVQADLQSHHFQYLLGNRDQLLKLDISRSFSEPNGDLTYIQLHLLDKYPKLQMLKWERLCLGSQTGDFRLFDHHKSKHADFDSFNDDPLRLAILEVSTQQEREASGKPEDETLKVQDVSDEVFKVQAVEDEVPKVQAPEDEFLKVQAVEDEVPKVQAPEDVEGVEDVEDTEDVEGVEDVEDEETKAQDLGDQTVETKKASMLSAILQQIDEVPLPVEEDVEEHEFTPFPRNPNHPLYTFEKQRNLQAEGKSQMGWESESGFRVIRNLRQAKKTVSREEWEESIKKADAIRARKPEAPLVLKRRFEQLTKAENEGEVREISDQKPRFQFFKPQKRREAKDKENIEEEDH